VKHWHGASPDFLIWLWKFPEKTAIANGVSWSAMKFIENNNYDFALLNPLFTIKIIAIYSYEMLEF
jgi:hypothetical protein